LKWWKGKFAEMILLNLFLPNQILNEKHKYKKFASDCNINANLKNYLEKFEVDDNRITITEDVKIFDFKFINDEDNYVIFLKDLNHFMGPDCYIFFHSKSQGNVIIKGAVKFFSKLKESISNKNKLLLDSDKYFTKNKYNSEKIENLKNMEGLKNKFKDLESNSKIYNFYLELPISKVKNLDDNEILIQYNNLKKFVDNQIYIIVEQLIFSIFLKEKKYYIDKYNFNFSQEDINYIEKFFKTKTNLTRNVNQTKKLFSCGNKR
jgi:hypothetical protein